MTLLPRSCFLVVAPIVAAATLLVGCQSGPVPGATGNGFPLSAPTIPPGMQTSSILPPEALPPAGGMNAGTVPAGQPAGAPITPWPSNPAQPMIPGQSAPQAAPYQENPAPSSAFGIPSHNPNAAIPAQPSTTTVPPIVQPMPGQGPAATSPATEPVFRNPGEVPVTPNLGMPPNITPAAGGVSSARRVYSLPEATDSGVELIRAQSPDDTGSVQQTAFQIPDNSGGLPPANLQQPVLPPGSDAWLNTPAPATGQFPINYADLDVYLSETQTGRINFGGAYNSESGVVGQFIIDERNFDLFGFPTRLSDFADGTAFRGAGQTFRLELVPGNEVQRYLVSFGEPFLFNTAVSFNFSAYLFDRRYFDWDEQRVGGRLGLGYRLTPDLSISGGVRLENVNISDPRVNTSPQLNAALGDTDLYVGNVGLIHDTRDHPFLATQGSYLSLMFSQGFGEYDFSRGDIDYRRYRLLYQRPDGSGRHTLSYGTKLGFTGSQTPIFENYYAGGFSSLRGFDFRGASPIEGGVRVGGEFQWLNSLEYMFPMTADDMIKGVLFCDFGTVEEGIEMNSENFRVAPGFGFRIHMPAAGIGAPLAFDFAFPVASADGDEEQVFSFYLGVLR